MSILSKAIRKISAPVAKVASIIPNPYAQAVAFGAGAIARDEARRQNKRIAEQERKKIMEIFRPSGNLSSLQAPLAGSSSPRNLASFGSSFFDTIRGGIQDVGGLVKDIFDTGIPGLFGAERPNTATTQPAITTVTNVGAKETGTSGTVDAGFLPAVGGLISGAKTALKSPLGQLILGTGAGAGIGMLTADGKRMRITRKMKSQARTVLNIAGGNVQVAADILNISPEMLISILLKRFRNDGPVVTKAALRKTKSTIRKLHNMQDVLKSITPTSTGRRRAPMKRSMSTTLIKN